MDPSRARDSHDDARQLLGRRLGDGRVDALHYCRLALAMHQEIGEMDSEAGVWDSLGFIHHGLQEYDEAVDCYRKALDRYRAVEDRYWIADTLVHLGDTYQAGGQAAAVSSAWREALDILDELGHSHAADVRLRLAGPAG